MGPDPKAEGECLGGRRVGRSHAPPAGPPRVGERPGRRSVEAGVPGGAAGRRRWRCGSLGLERFVVKVQIKAEAMVDRVAGLLVGVQKRDRPLADQIRRAAQSVVLELAEGEQVRGGNQRLHFERAAGSNAEMRAGLRMAARWGYVDRSQAAA